MPAVILCVNESTGRSEWQISLSQNGPTCSSVTRVAYREGWLEYSTK
jgi:hypothetical protein